jgi:uncharacterized protein with beta-barrel porin domain
VFIVEVPNAVLEDVMKRKLIPASVAAALMSWGASVWAAPPEVVVLPGVVGPTGVLEGVATVGAGILTVGNNQNINTNGVNANAITPGAAAQADVRFFGNSTVTGNVGIPSSLLNLNAGANGSTVNFNGLVNTATFNVTGTGTINFNGNVIGAGNFANDGFINLGTGLTLTGAIITATANTGTFTLNGGSSVIGAMGGANGLKLINVVGGNAAVTGAVQALGFNLGANTLAMTGALTTNAGGTIATTLASNTVFGRINPTGPSNINPSGITVIPTVTGLLTVGTNFRIVNGLAGPNGAPVFVVNNSPLFTFAGVPTTTGDVNILLTSATPVAAVVSAPFAQAAVVLLGAPAAPGSDLATVQNAVFALPTAAALNNAVAQLSPGTSNLAAPWVAGKATRLFEDMWAARVEEIQDLCCDTCEPGKSGAPANAQKCKGTERSNWWGKGFDNLGRQGDKDNVNGYQTKALGLMLAYDVPLNNQTRAGLGGGYANTTIDGNNIGGSTKIDSYQLTGYLSHAPGPWYVQGALTAGLDKYNGSRSIVFPGVSRTAAADYTGQQYTAVVTAGRHFYVAPTTIVTPLASLQASRIHVGSYTETGAGDVNLRVNSQDYNFVQSGLGVKAERIIQSGSGTYSPEVHFKWQHDFSSTTMQQNAAFTGGGATFTTQGIAQDRELFNVGAGLTFLSCNCGDKTWTVKGLYDYKWNQSNYTSHQVSIIASLKF